MKRLTLTIAATALAAGALTIATLPLAAKMMAEIAQGASIPANFAVRDAAGKPRTYRSISGKSGTVLVFTRSAKWCPFCQAQLKDLKGAQAALAQRGYSLAALSYDPPATLAGFAKAQGVGYTLLSDQGSKMIDAFGLRDEQYAPGTFAYGVAKASVLVIDTNGKVRAKMVSSDYRVRSTTAEILAAVDRK
jgi:peroxiredoxin